LHCFPKRQKLSDISNPRGWRTSALTTGYCILTISPGRRSIITRVKGYTLGNDTLSVVVNIGGDEFEGVTAPDMDHLSHGKRWDNVREGKPLSIPDIRHSCGYQGAVGGQRTSVLAAAMLAGYH
jgi:hypothetical protein